MRGWLVKPKSQKYLLAIFFNTMRVGTVRTDYAIKNIDVSRKRNQ